MTWLERLWRAVGAIVYWLVSIALGVLTTIGLTEAANALVYSFTIPSGGERIMTTDVATAHLIGRFAFIALWMAALIFFVILLPRYQRAVKEGRGWRLFLPVAGVEIVLIGLLRRFILSVLG